MPRHGKRGRGGRKEGGLNNGRYWNRSQEQSERPRPPPHLRGKAIGLFYRDLNKNKPKTDYRTFTIGLTIPPGVIKQVRNQLHTIASIAKVQNIDLSFVSRFKKIKQEHGVQIKTEPLELDNNEDEQVDFMSIEPKHKPKREPPPENYVPLFSTSTSNHPGTSKKIEISSESEDEEDPVPTFKKPWSEDLSDFRKYVHKSFNKTPKSPAEHFVGAEDFLPLNTENTTPIVHNEIIDLVEDEIDEDQFLVKLASSSNSDSEMTIPKPKLLNTKPFGESASNSSLEAEMTVPKPLMMPKPLLDPEPRNPDFAPFKSQLNTSAASDFIPIKQQEFTYGSGTSRQLSLRGGGDYKYSYQDIITGSFHDKLDECLAKGVSINISNNTDMKQLNETLYEEYVEMLDNAKYKKMLIFREKLPTYKKAEAVLDVIKNNSVVVISGETGCGKSTQVPQIILDYAISNRRGANTNILVTQPRRIAASSLAERVAEERAERLGNSVGYAVRLEKVEPRSRAGIKFCTTGILLAELEVNQGLTNISHVILDEVHERDTHVDLSMMMLKEILKKRRDLKVILMSATLNAPSLSAYFNNCAVLHIEGLAYPVRDVYMEQILHMTRYQHSEPTDRGRQYGPGNQREAKKMEKEIKHRAEVGPWLETVKHMLDRDVYKTLLDPRSEELDKRLIVCLLQHICRGEPGAILVFLPGIMDITNVLKEMDESGAFPPQSYDIYPLHSKLPSLEQKKIFERPPNGVRKIIIATNIAETSITIDDIVYVIDSGRLKLSGLNVEENVVTLQTEWVSKANLIQRRGRAGRCQPGICYHLFTTYRAETLSERLLPELQRSNLLEAVLMIKKLRLGRAEDALQMVADPPAESTVKWAVKHLQQLGALDETETLTPLGWHLARLPVHPAAGKLLLLGALFGCLERAASVAAVWGFKDPFMLVIGKEKEVDKAKHELKLDEPSDHVAISEAIMRWERAGHKQRSFAYNFFLSNSTLSLLSEMKRQFGDNLKQMGFLANADVRSTWENRNSGNLSLFKAVVAAALYPNVAHIKWHGLHSMNQHKNIHIIARTPEEGRVEIHPSSVMSCMFSNSGFGNKPRICNGAGANWLVYWLKQRSTKLFLLEVTCVYTLPLLFFGELRVEYDDKFPDDCFISISTVKVKCAKSTADLLFELRALLDHVLASKVMIASDHAVRSSEFEEEVLNAVMQLITAEDEQADCADDSFEDSDQSDYEPNHRRWRN